MLPGSLLPRPHGARSSRSTVASAFIAIFSLLAAFVVLGVATPSHADAPCGQGSSPIVCENSKPGTPRSVWDIGPTAGDADIQGFADQISVQPGGTINFKIDTDASAYSITIYRTGWYGGDGARQIATVTPSAHLPQTQPACIYDDTTEETDCGNWGVSASWAVPTTAVSGVYVADLYRADNDDVSQIIFVVTDPSSTSDIVVKTSDATWEAYNNYGGADFYQGGGPGRAYAISYNRPFNTRSGGTNHDNYFSAEYPLVEFLEENGYDVSYTTDVDVSTSTPALLEKHKTFISSGHDEYWTGEERTNVEAARDAGVNLQFLSGNEVYWHTRMTPSIDGSNTPNRTITSYKETWSNAKVDPSSTWTGTWRDPRFASEANGGSNPEQMLTGTMYMSNSDDLPVTVTSDQGDFKLWANTGLNNLAPGSSQELAQHTVGYESDEDVDDGFRQSGLLYLSTTVGQTPQYLQDFGSVVLPGTTTHHMTLYRAASGALVMSAGSIDWNWGLNENHDTGYLHDAEPADPRMQQFEVNMLADMGAQPLTLDSSLVAAAPSTDHTPPTATVVSPAPGSTIANGSKVTVSGTASDVGGVVAAIEISVDDGQTWHMATGTTSWSYSYVQQGIGTASILVRAVDDSANYAATPVKASYTLAGPYTALGATVPAHADTADTGAYELGLRFTASQDGMVTGVRFYKAAANTGTHIGTLWDANGNKLASVTFANESGSGWQQALFTTPVSMVAGQNYVVSYTDPAGHYAADPYYWAYRGESGPLAIAGGYGAPSAGVYGKPGAFPTGVSQNANYYVDAVFSDVDTNPLVATAQWPLPNSSSVPGNTTISAKLSRGIQPSSLAFTVTDQLGNAVAGSSSLDPSTETATFTPSHPLDNFVKYTVAVHATTTTGGLDVSSGGSWTFTTVKSDPVPGACPCGLFSDARTPATLQAADPLSVQLGVAFSPSANGEVTGVSFYKAPGNTGTHTGYLWSPTGTLLASGTFINESSSGWQTLTFDTPVPVTAGATYTASYLAPNGAYSVTPNGFGNGLTVGPLSATANAGAYIYGTGFPKTRTTNDYGVDVVYKKTPAPLALTSVAPASNAVAAAPNAPITATFTKPLSSGVAVSVTTGSGPVAGSTSLSSDGETATFAPSAALPAGATVTVKVSGIRDVDGLSLPDQGWTFIVADPSRPAPVTLLGNAVPDTASAADPSPVELGMSFSAASSGSVTAIRFYKGPDNTGTHVGHLWSASGTLMATATFTNEVGTGWQTAVLSSPVPLIAGTTYVVSYFAPNGDYATTTNGFAQAKTSGPLTAGTGNGLYKYAASGGFPNLSFKATNYFVDVVFQSAAAGSESVFPATSVPATPSNRDTAPAQVGVRLAASVNGQINGIRYYRSPGDNAVDTLTVWGPDRSLLATVIVAADAGSGWLDVPLPAPVSVTAGAEYRVTYYSTSKIYAATKNGLASPVTNGHLTALGGAYVYGTGYPASTSSANYWADVDFVPAS